MLFACKMEPKGEVGLCSFYVLASANFAPASYRLACGGGGDGNGHADSDGVGDGNEDGDGDSIMMTMKMMTNHPETWG